MKKRNIDMETAGAYTGLKVARAIRTTGCVCRVFGRFVAKSVVDSIKAIGNSWKHNELRFQDETRR